MMLLSLGMGSEFGTIEGVTASIYDLEPFPFVRKKWLVSGKIILQTLPDGVQGFRLGPLPAPVFKYPMKIKQLGLSETKLFHFHGIFKNNKIKSAKRTPPSPLNI